MANNLKVIGLLASESATSIVEVLSEKMTVLATTPRTASALAWTDQKLYSLKNGAVVLVRPDSNRMFFLLFDTNRNAFQIIEPLPGNLPIFAHQCAGHLDGTLTVIEVDHGDLQSRGNGKTKSTLWVNNIDSAHTKWTPILLPDGFFVAQVSKDSSGRFHMVGSAPSHRHRGKTEAAYAILQGQRVDFLRLPFSSKDIKEIEKNGFASEFTNVNATDLPLVISSDNLWGWDDPTTMIVIEGMGKASLRIIKKRLIVSLGRRHRNDLIVFSDDAYMYSTADYGGTWSEYPFRRAISKAWGGRNSSNLTISSALLAGGEKIVLVANDLDQSMQGQNISASGIFLSGDMGRSFELLASAPDQASRFLSIVSVKE